MTHANQVIVLPELIKHYINMKYEWFK